MAYFWGISRQPSQKKLFFNLRKIKNKINAIDDGDMNFEQVDHIANSLQVSKKDVIEMNRRMTNVDQSLNAPISRSDGNTGEWQDLLADNRTNQEKQYSDSDEISKKKNLENEEQRIRNSFF